MNLTEDSRVRDIWHRLSQASGDGRAQRVANSDVLAQYCGMTAEGKYVFYSRSDERPQDLEQLKALQILVHQDRVGKWVRSFVLLESDFFDEYSGLVEELSLVAQGEKSEQDALLAETQTYEKWLAFYKKRTGFSPSMARGLFGELWVLRTEHDQRRISWSSALTSWCGPEESPQDFIFGIDEAIEVKTIQLASQRVKINGSEQLLFHGSLVLRVLRVSASDAASDGETLAAIVEGIESKLTPIERATFQEKLVRVGYDAKSDVANRLFFTVVEETNYLVTGQFPRITANSLSPSVGDVTYTIKLSGLEGFRQVES